MARYLCMDTLRFLLFDVHQAETLLAYDHYHGFDKGAFDMLLDAAKVWADQDFYPYFKEMDEKPAFYAEGRVHTHPILKKIFADAGANGWLGMYFDKEDGGIQLPHVLQSSINHILESANNHIPGYLGLTAGAAHLIASFGSDALKKTYIPPMLAGQWGGTMALTEPQAGSSLSDITTAATPHTDGHYLIRGQKIFISAGDHEAADNIIHLTLARIEGAPAGTKGISLFVVPKFRLDENRAMVPNDVCAVGDFQKMGQRGYSTVHLVYGENHDCHGYLVGEPHQGLKYMFQLMNGARIDVGMTAASIATAAYYASLQYAGERPQGRKILNSGKKDVSEEQTLIIEHPDVRRMLLWQKAIVEGSLSLLLECAKLADEAQAADKDTARDSHLLLELLTPVAKTFPAEMGRMSVDQGLQVLGGYGFCMDFPLQQYLRDIRIMAIYEGTTGIQSLDLLSRKIPMDGGKAMQLLKDRMSKTINEAMQMDALKDYAGRLQTSVSDVERALAYLMGFAMQGDYEKYLADATVFMEMFGRTVVGWQWLKMACIGQVALQTKQAGYPPFFLEAKQKAMQCYYIYELPKVSSSLETLIAGVFLTLAEEGDDWLKSQ
jgi:alkylation response protein AidB-like acyl-CoA dehydrogenase